MMPFLLALAGLFGVGAVASKIVLDEVDETIQNTTPNIVLIGGLVIAGLLVWRLSKK